MQQVDDYLKLHNTISERHHELSKRLRQIASFALDHPTEMALGTVVGISHSAGVQPSALIRFAKAFGYSGFSEMQRVFRSNVAKQSASYKERIQHDLDATNQFEPKSTFELMNQFCAVNIASLEHLSDGIEPDDLSKATNILRSASSIYVIGQRRSYPIATYLTYAFSHVDCRVHLLDGSGGLLMEQASAMTSNDALIVISFHPYSADTVAVASVALNKAVPIISITDSILSPAAKNADVCFAIHDAELFSFRSLSASLCVAQTLATSLAFTDNFK